MTDEDKALKYLYRLISKREYTEKDLQDKLYQKGFSKSTAEISLNRLKELGYINDKDFAINFIKSQINKLEGPNKIKNKLFMHGLLDYEYLLKEIYSRDLIIKNLKTLIEKKKNKHIDNDKIISFCSRKGYAISDIINIMKNFNDF
jgi:regulatory protein